MNHQAIDKHVMVAFGQSFRQLCEPVFNTTPINYIGFARFYPDGRRSYLVSDPSWGKVLLMNDYHLAGNEDTLLQGPDSSYYPWFLTNMFNLNQKTRELYKECVAHNYGNGITLVQRGSAFVEFFHICATGGYDKVNEFLTSNVDKLWQVVLYLKEQIYRHKPIKQAYNTKYNYLTPILRDNSLQEKNLLQSFPIRKFYLSGEFGDVAFTKREIDCLLLLFQNKTIDQQAFILKISPRTVETHLANIKQKAKIPSTRALLVKLSENNCFQSLLATHHLP